MKKSFRIMSTVLVVLMLVPMLAALSVHAETPTYVAYKDAKIGDLLYHVCFNKETDGGAWQAAPASGWDGMTTEISADGYSVTMTPVAGKNNRSSFGAELNLDVTGASFTTVFTLEASDEKQFVCFYPDWSNGFVIYPAAKKTSIGSVGNATKIAGTQTYESGTTGAQTYAIEFAVNADHTGYTSYKLFVKDGENWILLRDAGKEGKLDAMTPGWDNTDHEYLFRFARLAGYTDQTTGTVTAKDINVYKGLLFTYEGAADGDLLYHVNFKGDEIWTPVSASTTSSSYDTMIAEVADDGESVTLSCTSDKGKGRAIWGDALNTKLYTVTDRAYTVEFTVTGETADQEVGFYPDWGTGFIVAPGLNRFRVGQWGNQVKVHTNDYYAGTGALTQTYAVEFAVTSEKHGDFATVTDYRLFVKNGDAWSLVYELSADKMSNELEGVSELDAMQWGVGADTELMMRFFRNPVQTGKATVSNVNVYKGLLSKSLTPKEPLTGGTIDPTAVEDGELLYKVNFAGDDNYAPGAFGSLPVLNATVDANDNGKVTLSVPTGEDGLYHYWGGEIKGMPFDDQSSYTVFITYERSKALSATDPFVGVSVDGLYYLVGDSSGIQLVKGPLGKVRSAVTYADAGSVLFTVEGDHGADYDATTEPFTQTIAIEIDGPEMDKRAIRFYAKTTDGDFQLITNSDSGSNVDFYNDNLSLYFIQKDADTPITVNSVEYYKGMTVDAYNQALLEEKEKENEGEDEEPDDPTGGNEPEEPTVDPKPEDKKDDEKDEKGCGSSVVSTMAVIAVVTLGSSALVIRKKKIGDAE